MLTAEVQNLVQIAAGFRDRGEPASAAAVCAGRARGGSRRSTRRSRTRPQNVVAAAAGGLRIIGRLPARSGRPPRRPGAGRRGAVRVPAVRYPVGRDGGPPTPPAAALARRATPAERAELTERVRQVVPGTGRRGCVLLELDPRALARLPAGTGGRRPRRRGVSGPLPRTRPDRAGRGPAIRIGAGRRRRRGDGPRSNAPAARTRRPPRRTRPAGPRRRPRSRPPRIGGRLAARAVAGRVLHQPGGMGRGPGPRPPGVRGAAHVGGLPHAPGVCRTSRRLGRAAGRAAPRAENTGVGRGAGESVSRRGRDRRRSQTGHEKNLENRAPAARSRPN